MGRFQAVGIAGAVLFVVACGNATNNGPASTHAALSTVAPVSVSVVTPDPTAPPTSSGYTVGDTVTTTTNSTFTVLGLTTNVRLGQYALDTPPPGGHELAAKIKECAGTDLTSSSSTDWSAQLADATQITGTFQEDATPGPMLPIQNLNPGACDAGWVYFNVPSSPAVTEIVLSNSDFYWTVSG